MKLMMWLVLGSDGQGVGMGQCMLGVSGWREVGRCDEKWGKWELCLFGGRMKGQEWEKIEWEWKGRAGAVEIACVECEMILMICDR